MSLEDIKSKIMADARSKKEEMLKEANDKKEEVLREYRMKVDAFKKDILEKSNFEGEGLKKGIVIDSKLKLKNEVLKQKRELIESVINSAKESFTASNEYSDFMKTLLLKAIETGSEEIIVSKNEKVIDQKWIDQVNKETKRQLKMSNEKGNFSGGLILKNEDVFVNITIEVLIDQLREGLEKDLNKVLFA